MAAKVTCNDCTHENANFSPFEFRPIKMYKFQDQIDIRTKMIPAENKNEAGIIGAAIGAFDEVG